MMECAHLYFGAKTICQNILSNYKKAAHMKLGWFFIFSKNFFSINWGWILSGRRQQGLKVKRNFRFWSHWRKTCRSCHKFSRLFEKRKTLKSTLQKYTLKIRIHSLEPLKARKSCGSCQKFSRLTKTSSSTH